MLDLCQRNITRNGGEVSGQVLVREMDWTQPFNPSLPSMSTCINSSKKLILCLHVVILLYLNALSVSTGKKASQVFKMQVYVL